jgi:hypothetical protein
LPLKPVLSGYATPNLGVGVPRDHFFSEQIDRIRRLMTAQTPPFLLCYGLNPYVRPTACHPEDSIDFTTAAMPRE